MSGQVVFEPPNVAGWDASRWIDTATWRGRWMVANAALERRLGVPTNELLGENVGDFLHPEDRVATVPAWQELLAGEPQGAIIASALPVDTEGAADGADNGGAEYIFRLASPVGIYAGTLEVFRNMIAQHALGLGRPNYSPPRS